VCTGSCLPEVPARPTASRPIALPAIICNPASETRTVLNIAIAVSTALAATAAAGFAASALFGRSLSGFELAALFFGLIFIGWVATVLHRKRTRRRLMDMRDSALW
jgi:hypothetical protein